MKVVAWNLGHRTNPKAIPAELVEIFAALEADTVLLNEFVDGPDRDDFRAALVAAGYPNQLVSWTPGKHNQIFVASRRPLVAGDLLGPAKDGPSRAGFLHVRFRDTDLELVGLRAPAYEKALDKHDYWDQLAAILQPVADRPIAFAGDFNRDPFREARELDASIVEFAAIAGYQVPNPDGSWSFVNHQGSGHSRVDHVAHTRQVAIDDARYVTNCGLHVLAGPDRAAPISDHAALVFTAQAG